MARFCTECGNQIADDVVFCTECGVKVAPKAIAETTVPEILLATAETPPVSQPQPQPRFQQERQPQ